MNGEMTAYGQRDKSFYERFIEETDAILAKGLDANASAAHVVGEFTRAAKRAQMVLDGELDPVADR